MTSNKAGRIADYVDHILQAITRIETYIVGFDQTSFVQNSLVQDAVIRNLEIIGEAANNMKEVDPAFWEAHSELRLEAAYKMRNALIHGYSTVNLLTVWNTAQTDLPILKAQIITLQRQL